VGIISYYDYRDSARWAAFAIWWIAVALTLFVSFGLLIVQMMKQEPHSIEDVAGLYDAPLRKFLLQIRVNSAPVG
jgi:hypothetical protein